MKRTLLAFTIVLWSVSGCSSSTDTQSDSDDIIFLPGGFDGTGEGDSSDPNGDAKPEQEVQILPDGAIVVPDGTNEEDIPFNPDEFAIRFVTPSNGDTATGSIVVRIEAVGIDELVLTSLSVTLNDQWIFGDGKLPTEFVLDTTTYSNFPNLNLEATAQWNGQEATDKLQLGLSNPSFDLVAVEADSFVRQNGDSLGILVNAGEDGLNVSANFSNLDTNYVDGLEAVSAQGNGVYLVTYNISSANSRFDGTYVIPISVTDGVHTADFSGLEVTLQNNPTLPLRPQRGLFVSGSIPGPTPTWVQPISLIYGNDFIITGGSAKVSVDFGGYVMKDEIVGILVGAEGYYGYYQIPLDQTTGDEEMLLLLKTYLESETPPNSLKLNIALQDARGRISPVKTHELSVQTVGNGDVQVSVSWDADTDIDLHVIEPGGCELYYSNKTCSSGGWLDLDSNPACSIDGINNENVFWPEFEAPLGTYIVRVDYYDDCGIFGPGKDTNATVTIHYCGFVEVYEQFFAKGSDDGGGAGDGKTIAEFNNEQCGRILRGRVRYQDRTFDARGFQAAVWKPVRFATIEVHRKSDDQLIGTGYTDRMGDYEARFNNVGAGEIYVKVTSITNLEDGLRAIQVMNHPKFQQIYSVSSASLDAESQDVPVVNIDITEADGAGAFNIFDVVSGGYDLIRLMTGQNLGQLNVYWATGADTTSTIFCNDYFYENGICTEHMALSVQGKEIDRDEWDDMVILKEFFKFGLARTSRDDNPGGEHIGTRDDPRRSWTEGVSTFFACDVTGSRNYVNSLPFAVYQVLDLEEINSPFAFKTDNGLMFGNISEYLVASLLWDIADGTNAESFDTLAGKRLPIYDSIFTYMDHHLFADRGPDGVDLIDFLDGWFCRGWEDKDGLQQLLLYYQMAYDWDGPSGCFGG